MKTLLVALVFSVIGDTAQVDAQSSAPTQLSAGSFPIVFLKNKDGTVTPAYSTYDGRPVIIYRWNNIEIDCRNIPNLDMPTGPGGLDFSPQIKPESTPYQQWSGLNVKRIDPPVAYYWDQQAGGFRAGYSDSWHGFFFKLGDQLYQKAQLTTGAQVLNKQSLKVIPIDSISYR